MIATQTNFNTLKEYNNNNNKFLAEHKNDLTPTEYIAFKHFTKMAVDSKNKIYGASIASIRYIVQCISDTILKKSGISRSTVKRMLKKIKDFGLIEVIEREGKNGRQTSNLYIFKKFGVRSKKQTFSTNEPPRTEGEQDKPAKQKENNFRQLNHRNTSNNFYTNINLNKRVRNVYDFTIPSEYVNKSIPSTFRKASSVLNDALLIEELYRMANITRKKASFEITDADFMSCCKEALMVTIKAIKTRKSKNTPAYFTGTLRKLLKRTYKEFYKPLENKDMIRNRIASAIKKRFTIPQIGDFRAFVSEDELKASKQELDEMGIF